MGHTCEDCEERFETLTQLRLHDCPAPTDLDAELARRLVAETEAGLERGDLVSALPKRALLPEVLADLTDDEEVLTVIPLMSGRPEDDTTERFALQTVAGGYVIEYFPHNGWFVVRTVSGAGKSEGETLDDLMEQVQEWQGVVAEIALDHASDPAEAQERLYQELDRPP